MRKNLRLPNQMLDNTEFTSSNDCAIDGFQRPNSARIGIGKGFEIAGVLMKCLRS